MTIPAQTYLPIVLVNLMSPNGNCLNPTGRPSVFGILPIYRLPAQQQHEIQRELSIVRHREGKPKEFLY